jgi:uncharacterized protein
MVRYFLLGALLVGGCGFGDDRRLGGSVDGGVDAMKDGPVGEQGEHLLLTEVKSTAPSLPATSTGEFVEIWNPTNKEIQLDKYYLSDVGDYWKYPSATNAPRVDISDFIVRFPTGAVIPSDGVITVAITEAGLPSATYAVNSTTGLKAMASRIVPEGGGMAATITDGGEVVALFYWDGVSDTVKDVDIVVAGANPTSGNTLQPKVSIDGPDADMVNTPYKPDNGLLGGYMNVVTAVASGTSYKRRSLETGSEAQLGNGNGITGHDETSEPLKATWDGDTAAPLSLPTPGVVPAI